MTCSGCEDVFFAPHDDLDDEGRSSSGRGVGSSAFDNRVEACQGARIRGRSQPEAQIVALWTITPTSGGN